MLLDLVDNTKTDKNTYHSYLGSYEKLFCGIRESAQNVLEIGIGGGGGSIKLWFDYFSNAHIHGVDRMNINDVWEKIKCENRIHLYTSVNAYDINFFNNYIKNKKYDVILDDGSHNLQDMLFLIQNYLPCLTDKGIFIIEDVPDINYIDILRMAVPEDLRKYVEVFDLRHEKNRGDDILFVVKY